jgi:mannosyl-3-phosphoglycerate phosphatase family protein
MVGMMKLVFSDLDETLLDEKTYSFEAALAALHALRELNIPLILCSSKTRAEIEFWRERLENQHPFVVENGGAIFVPRQYFPHKPREAKRQVNAYDVIEFGTRYPVLVAALREASAISGCKVRGFNDMTAAEISRRTLLPLEQAKLAKQREYDEAFEILGSNGDQLLQEIEKMGMQWTRGGRFHHILGRNNKGVAVKCLIAIYRSAFGEVETLGFGDGPNDIQFLGEMDRAVVIRSRFAEDLAAAIPRSMITRSPGPRGWNETLLELLRQDVHRFC